MRRVDGLPYARHLTKIDTPLYGDAVQRGADFEFKGSQAKRIFNADNDDVQVLNAVTAPTARETRVASRLPDPKRRIKLKKLNINAPIDFFAINENEDDDMAVIDDMSASYSSGMI